MNKLLHKNKKGDIQSIIILITIVFAIAIGGIAFSKVFITITDEMVQTPEIATHNNTVQTIQEVQGKTIPLMDFFIFFSLISLMIGIIISAIYVDTTPALLIIFIVAFIVAIFLGGMFANVFDEFTSDSVISDIAQEFTMTNLILGSHFPIIIFVLGVIVVVILYGKSKYSGGVA